MHALHTRAEGRSSSRGHGRGMAPELTAEEAAALPLAPSLSDFNFIYGAPNDPLEDADGAVLLWSE